jgi:cytidylate kinase
MSVITISRELGSEGSKIARQAALALGFQLVDKKMIENVLSQYGLVQFGEAYDAAPGFWVRLDSTRERMIDMLDRVLEAMAYHGQVVILGRGSFAVLNGYADVLNVRVQAPLDLRIKRVMLEQNIREWDKAEALVKESDKVRAAFIQTWYGVHWDLASAFDLVIDTGKISPDLAVNWLVEAHRSLARSPSPINVPVTRSLEIDTILLETVNAVLEKSAQTI